MGLIGFYIAQGYKIAYMAILGPFWPVGILPKRYNEVILKLSHNMLKLHSALNGGNYYYYYYYYYYFQDTHHARTGAPVNSPQCTTGSCWFFPGSSWALKPY